MQIADPVFVYLSILIWPIMICVILFGFRKQVRELAGRMVRIRVPGIDAKFSDAVVEVAESAKEGVRNQVAAAEEILAAGGGAEAGPESSKDGQADRDAMHQRGWGWPSVRSLSRRDPEGAVHRSWALIEEELLATARMAGLDRGRLSSIEIADQLAFPQNIYASIRGLGRAHYELLRRRELFDLEGYNDYVLLASEAAAEYVVSCFDLHEWIHQWRAGANLL